MGEYNDRLLFLPPYTTPSTRLGTLSKQNASKYDSVFKAALQRPSALKFSCFFNLKFEI